MSLLFVDTETTGFSPKDSAPFEIAFVFMSATKSGQYYEVKKGFRLNPLGNGIKYYEKAAEAHGVSEKTIRGYPPANAVVPEIRTFLQSCVNGYGLCEKEKPNLAGWHVNFDFSHLKALLGRHGVRIEDYIKPKKIDVMNMAKSASVRRLISVSDYRLETVSNILDVANIKEHSAAGDVTATIEVARKLRELGVKI